MKEHPILFTGEMVKAILEGRKTQTRRVIKPQPFDVAQSRRLDNDGLLPTMENPHTPKYIKCPYGKPGDVLWVRESFIPCTPGHQSCKIRDATYVCYRDGTQKDKASGNVAPWQGPATAKWKKGYHKFSPSIHMPRWASRISLTVTDVRVERVQDISSDDARAEGIGDENEWLPCPACGGAGVHGAFGEGYSVTEVDCSTCNTPRKAFRVLWDSINADRGFGWAENPWAWAVTFERIEE